MKFSKEFERLGMTMQDDFGVFGLDYSFYFPYRNQDSLITEASLSTQAHANGDILNLRDMCVMNNRYPNKRWICMSSKHGRKICKNGCMVQLPIDMLNNFQFINFGYGFKDNIIRFSVPINIGISNETPCAGLEIQLMIEDPNDPDLIIRVYKKTSDCGWQSYIYAVGSERLEQQFGSFNADRITWLTSDTTKENVTESRWINFKETINLSPSVLEDVMM